MRTVLVTGPGGAGRTTLAAATARAAARTGTRVLLLTADPGDRLGTALGTPLGPAPVEAAPGLHALRLDAADRLRADLLALQERAATALDALGATPLAADELTPLPGAEELALLRALRELLALPRQRPRPPGPRRRRPARRPRAGPAVPPGELRRYLARLLPAERQAARALRPLLGRLAGLPLPGEGLYAAAARWDTELAAAQAALTRPGTSVTLVAEPGPAGADALREARTALALHALPAGPVLANRVLPAEGAGAWAAPLLAQQAKTLDAWDQDPGGPAVRVPHLGHDPRGPEDLDALGVPAPGPVPAAAGPRVEDRLAEDGVLLWRLELPGATRDQLDLVRRSDELVVTAGPFRRILPLPAALRRCTVAGAALRDGALTVRFAPDPAQWPQGR
ncbi:Arsenical pump-driving ATPase [Streptomyces albidoflavus]|nr:ArsA-related P-loop ATPase [Streptomyces albidoflavus]CAI4156314.1 Arsenical pump-driving ATPase [Streptomyces albidoflavus]